MRKAQGITIMQRFFDLFSKHLMLSIGLLDQAEFDDLLALKKDSVPGPDGIPYGVYRCAAFQAELEGSSIPDGLAESRTVFFPKTSDTDDVGRIIRSPDALRSSIDFGPYLCYCRGHHWYTAMYSHLSEMHLLQADDGQHL